ncbi:hypothetical protein DPMN_109771 [Dreissena polymorpha]|uniref:MI domain-containing protein n=1 Tax=Dreissena polymorpha TaxID=45954 RepID=A0A9D4QMB0_DREPO|nr:hypothetical protein DPMN_109771 [Dreissena polymorpha]
MKNMGKPKPADGALKLLRAMQANITDKLISLKSSDQRQVKITDKSRLISLTSNSQANITDKARQISLTSNSQAQITDKSSRQADDHLPDGDKPGGIEEDYLPHHSVQSVLRGMKLKPGQERFCMLDRKYVEPFQAMFKEQYETIHRLETNKLRNVAKFIAHLLFTDSISWAKKPQHTQGPVPYAS